MSSESNSAQAAAEWLRDYMPRYKWMSNGHLQTIAGNFLPRRNSLPPAERTIVEVEPASGASAASSVLCLCHWQPPEVRKHRLTLILVHGLEGSAESQYVIGNANKAWAAGANVIRMNMRNCGDTEALTPKLYHSGLSGDLAAVAKYFVDAQDLSSIALVGYSMGGNLVIKLAGELADHAPHYIKAAVGISPAIDLDASSAALHRSFNRIYERKFLQSLLRRFRRKAALFPETYSLEMFPRIRSIRDFDREIVARYCGFESAEDYYYRAAGARVIAQIRIPTLIVHSLDDPFIRLTPETRAEIFANPAIRYIETQHGGHCAFLDRAIHEHTAANGPYDGYWAEQTLLGFLLDATSAAEASESAISDATISSATGE